MAIKYLDAKRIRGSSTEPTTVTQATGSTSDNSVYYNTGSHQRRFLGERFNTGHALVGKTITEVQFDLLKSGSPNDVYKLVVLSTSDAVTTLESVDLSLVGTSFATYTFDDFTSFTLGAGERIGIYANAQSGGGSTPYVRVAHTSSDVIANANMYAIHDEGNGDVTGDLKYTIKYGTDEKATLVTAEAPPLTDPIKTGGFVMDISWYRGSGDTSHISNNDSNRVFVSSNTAGYTQSGQTSTDRQIGLMLSSGHTHGIMNWGSSGSAWASANNNVQASGSWRYFRFIFDDSENTFQWYRFTSESDRDAMTVSSHTNSEHGVAASPDAGTNFDTGKDLKYLTVTALDNGGSSTDFKLDDIKFWKNTEDAVTGSPTPDVHITFADGTGWTALSGKGSVTGGELVMTGDSSTPAVYTIPDTPASTNLPENTLFEETDTRKVYFLQSTEWLPVSNPAFALVFQEDTGWTGDTQKWNYSVADDGIRCQTTNNNRAVVKTIPALSGSGKWVARFEFHRRSDDEGDGVMVGFTSSTFTGNDSALYRFQNDAGYASGLLVYQANSGNEFFFAGRTPANGWDGASSGSGFTNGANTVTYVELIHRSDTDVSVNFYTDSAFSTGKVTVDRTFTASSGASSFDFNQICLATQWSSSNEHQVHIRNLEVKEGVTSF